MLYILDWFKRRWLELKPEKPSSWHYIAIHHSLTKDGKRVSWNAIRNYHVNTLRWKDIGYHFGIEKIGARYEILFGRMPNERGAHVRGFNDVALGICLVGNYDKGKPPEAQLELARKLIRWLMQEFEIPAERVVGHRELDPRKTCPGLEFDLYVFIVSLA